MSQACWYCVCKHHIQLYPNKVWNCLKGIKNQNVFVLAFSKSMVLKKLYKTLVFLVKQVFLLWISPYFVSKNSPIIFPTSVPIAQFYFLMEISGLPITQSCYFYFYFLLIFSNFLSFLSISEFKYNHSFLKYLVEVEMFRTTSL